MAKGVGRFWSAAGEAEYRRIYEEARALWPAHDVRRVDTSYGTVQTLTVGSGDATPVVLLHGMSCTSLMWRPNVEALAATRQVIAIDSIVDCGGGTQTSPAPDLSAVVDSVTQTLDGLGVERAHLVGLSYGAWTAAGLARLAPGRVASTSLLEPAATIQSLRPAYLLGFATSLVRPTPRRWKHLFARRPADDLVALLDASRRFWPAAPLPSVFGDDDLAALPGPIHVILGERSTATDAGYTRKRLGQLLPGAGLTVIPDAGHMVSIDAPDPVNDALLRFLEEATP